MKLPSDFFTFNYEKLPIVTQELSAASLTRRLSWTLSLADYTSTPTFEDTPINWPHPYPIPSNPDPPLPISMLSSAKVIKL